MKRVETLPKASLKERLGSLVEKAVVFVTTTFNPFGCGYANMGGTSLEVHDHGHHGIVGYLEGGEGNLVVMVRGVPVRYDPEIHGQITEWVKEGEPLPSVSIKAVHSHEKRNKFGPYEF